MLHTLTLQGQDVQSAHGGGRGRTVHSTPAGRIEGALHELFGSLHSHPMPDFSGTSRSVDLLPFVILLSS